MEKFFFQKWKLLFVRENINQREKTFYKKKIFILNVMKDIQNPLKVLLKYYSVEICNKNKNSKQTRF